MRTATQVAVVGSPSTNWEITMELLGTAAHEPLVGGMLFLQTPLGEGHELALGVVTEVTTVNSWHANPLMRGVVKSRGEIPGMSGDAGDVRAATIKLQACYKRQPGEVTAGDWAQSGPSLRQSPPTGTAIRRVSNDVINELMAGEDDLHYLGLLHGSEDVKVPMSIRDFASDRGAYHAGVFGMSGSGKSAMSAYFLAGQMRHVDHGMIVIDPQGQWSSETGLPFSLQAWAAEMGREVIVRRISEDIRLEQDAPLLGELLAKTRFMRELMKMSADTQEILKDEIVKILRAIPDWTDKPSEDVLRTILEELREHDVLRRVYADKSRQERLILAISEVLGYLPDETLDGEAPDPTLWRLPAKAVMDQRFKDLNSQWMPLHNLFAPTNPGGGARHSLWGTISRVFDKDARHGAPAPLTILDMSTSGQVSWISSLLADADQQEMLDALRILDQDDIKAAILSQTFRTLKRASENAFRDGDTLNTQVILDEAWRYAPPPHSASTDEIKELSIELAGYARDFRKFGIGLTFVTQSTRSLNDDIWAQLSVRIMGYGLSGADLAKVGETLDDPDHLKLYRGFAPPDSTKPRVYPFMVTGPVSPLSFTKAPTFIAAYTDFDDFRADNIKWISELRASLGQSVRSGTPTRPGARTVTVPKAGPRPVGKRETAEQIERVRANRATGGVDPNAGAGLSRDPGFASAALAGIDDDDPPRDVLSTMRRSAAGGAVPQAPDGEEPPF